MGTLRPLTLCIVVVALSFSGCTRATKPPDAVLMVTIDTLRADRTSAYGYARDTTPFLASLAQEGVRFASAYTTMPTTDPAHVSMLTGLHPAEHGVRRNGQVLSDQRTPTLASWFAERGYRTAAITARAHLNPKDLRLRGFASVDAPRPPKVTRDASDVLARARATIESFEAAPWFLWVHLWEPHAPYDPPAEFADKFYTGVRLPGGGVPGRYREPPNLEGSHPFGEDELAAVGELYDGEVAAVDAALRGLVELARQGTGGNGSLLVSVSSDHGETLGEHRLQTGIAFGHGTILHEELLRVPWVIWWPQYLRPHEIATPVSLIDFAATLSGLCDPSAPLTGSGRSHAGVLLRRGQPEASPILVERRPYAAPPAPGLGTKQWAYLDWPWKLIRIRDAANAEPRFALYRLDRDPLEREDLYALEPATALGLVAALEEAIGEEPKRGEAPGAVGLTDPRKRENLRSLGYVD